MLAFVVAGVIQGVPARFLWRGSGPGLALTLALGARVGVGSR